MFFGFGLAPRTCASNVADPPRSEEHTSELQSQSNLVCRLLLEKKKKTMNDPDVQRRRCSCDGKARVRCSLPPSTCPFQTDTTRLLMLDLSVYRSSVQRA